MAIFKITKYSETQPKQEDTKPEQQPEREKTATLKLNVSESVASTVAKFLFEKFKQNDKEPQNTNFEIDEDNEETDETPQVTVVSKEDINADPAKLYNSLKSGTVVIIQNKTAFTTAKEQWFISNIEEKGVNISYNLNSFIDNKLGTV